MGCNKGLSVSDLYKPGGFAQPVAEIEPFREVQVLAVERLAGVLG